MKLSVFIVTYNQEQYIKDCIESVINQNITCDYEIVIGDDCSTDSTPQICDEYAANYPFITVYHHQQNLGLIKNWEFVFNHCNGEYIALLEGDDYWIDNNKILKQINFLDQHTDYSAVFTQAKILYMPDAAKGAEVDLPSLPEREYTVQEMCSHFIMLSSSTMCRRSILPIKYPKNLLYADIYTFIQMFEKGRVYCLGEQTTMYRIHSKNLSRQGDSSFFIDSFRMSRYFMRKYPYVADIYKKRIDVCLKHLMYDKKISAWKFRLYYMLHNPRLLFSRFMLSTLKTYMLGL